MLTRGALCSWVQTEMGNAGARFLGMEKALITIEQSVPDMVKVVSASIFQTKRRYRADIDKLIDR